jgi:hypothetical protein
MSAVQALAALLSSNADAQSRLGSAAMAANAATANGQAALQGDMYRTNMQGQLGAANLQADAQRTAAELGLRRAIAQRQFGNDASRLSLAKQQLGFDQSQAGVDRDIKLAELGQGRYAPQSPFDDDFKSQFNAANPQEALAMFAKRMILGNATNPRMMAGMGGLFESLAANQGRSDERAWKEKMAKDPTALSIALAPVVGGMEGMTPQQFPGAMQQLLSSLGIGGAAQSTASGKSPLESPMDMTQATSTLSSPQNADLLKAFGITDSQPLWQVGETIGERAGSLTRSDIEALQQIFAAKFKTNPQMFDRYEQSHPGIKLLRRMLESSSDNLDGPQLQSDYSSQRSDYYKSRNDPRNTWMFGIPKMW